MENKILLILIIIFTFSSLALSIPKQAIILTGQSNMGKSAMFIRELMPNHRIVNCSVGGSSITEWQKGEYNYEKCLQIVQILQRDGYKIAGIFFFQGERDSHSPLIAIRWKWFFYKFVNNFRSDISERKIPIIFAQLGKKAPIQPGTWGIVQFQQRRSQSSEMNLYMIKTNDIEPYCQELSPHFCPEAYPIIAQRFVDEFRNH